MALIVKICGLRTEDAVEAAADAGADMAGFVFFPPSPRDVTPSEAARLAASLPERMMSVALTVDANNRLIDTIMETLRPGMIQAHGHESPGRIEEIRSRTGAPVMKALPVTAAADLAAASAFEGHVDRLLFDARPPRGATRPGGHGIPFDWRLMRRYAGVLPWMLSGGLDPDNVGAAIFASGTDAVDVSSGVERAPGVKDAGLIRAFVAAAREAECRAKERA